MPQGPGNELHEAIIHGPHERVPALLADGSVDIDERDLNGFTPLMLAAGNGCSRIVKMLLTKGANVSIVDVNGNTALHLTVQEGQVAATKLLVEAGADLEAADSDGSSPLLLAAEEGHSFLMSVLIEAGANPNSRTLDGTTPLYVAATQGHLDAVKVLLRAKADPMLATPSASGTGFVPLDMAVQKGHLQMVQELIQQVGIKGCGGESGGLLALNVAAREQHVEIMALLTDAGVIDTGGALIKAAKFGREESAKFLVQQKGLKNWDVDGGVYVNASSPEGTPLICCVVNCGPRSPRIVRLLVDAGADTTSAVQFGSKAGRVVFDDTPLALATFFLRQKKFPGGIRATEKQLQWLEAIRRLLLRVETVHAVSWLWPNAAPSPAPAAAEVTGKKGAASTPLTAMLAILRRRARRPGIVLATLFRWVVMLDMSRLAALFGQCPIAAVASVRVLFGGGRSRILLLPLEER